MRDYRNMLLAGVAALALVAGTGLASAQAPNGAAQGGPQHASQPMKGSGPGMQAQSQGKAGPTAQNAQQGTRPNAGGEQPGPQQNANSAKQGPQQNAKGKESGQPSVAQKTGRENGKQNQAINGSKQANRPHAARSERRNGGRQTTAQQQRVLHGLQGNASNQMQGNGAEGAKGPQGAAAASGANVRLSQRQRTQIQHTIIDARGAPRAGHVDFDVRVGTVIPRGRIHVIPVPETLVRIEPRWRGLLYFVYADEVVIVNPHDMRIVAVLPV